MMCKYCCGRYNSTKQRVEMIMDIINLDYKDGMEEPLMSRLWFWLNLND